MKKILGTVICSVVLLSLFSGQCFSQESEIYSKHLGIGMSVPKDFKITSNSIVEFSASDKDLSIVIHPFSRQDLSLENMEEVLIDHGEELGYNSLSNAETIELNGFQGCYAIENKNGRSTLTMLLLNQQSSKNLFIVINYSGKSEKTALAVANSFYVYD